MPDTRVVFLHNIWTPYRAALFARIAGLGAMDFRVIYTAASEPNRLWRVPTPEELPANCEYLPGTRIRVLGRNWWWNPGLAARLESIRPGAVVITGLGAWSSLAAMAWCWARRVPIVLWDESCGVGVWRRIRGSRSGTPFGSRVATGEASGHPANVESDLERLIKSRLMARIALVMVPGAAAATFQLETLGVECGRIAVVGDPVDNLMFSSGAEAAASVRHRWGVADDAVVFLYVGHLSREKGVDLLLDAFAGLEANGQVELVLVGEGELRKRAESQAGVRCEGFVEPAGLPPVYAAANVFVFPTLHDVWGLVVNEAMAAGLPVVCSRFAGCAVDLVDARNGAVVDPRDKAQLVSAMKRLCDRGVRLPMRSVSLERIAKMSLDGTARLMTRAMLRAVDAYHA